MQGIWILCHDQQQAGKKILERFQDPERGEATGEGRNRMGESRVINDLSSI